MTAKASELRHAILILAHEDPALLLRLVSRLQHPRVRVFIHIDRKKVKDFDLGALERLGITVISTQKVNWGGFSNCRAQLDLLRLARTSGPFATYTLISGRDYPVNKMSAIVSELDAETMNLIDNWHDEDPSWHRRYARMRFYDYPGARLLNAVSRRAAPFLPDRRVPHQLKVFFGWAWWTLREDGVEAVLRFCEERPDVVRWYRFMHIADESFFQTALRNVSSPPSLSRKTHRYIRFPGGSANPKTIDHGDLDAALSGEYWFARKVYSEGNPGVLDEIDRRVGGEVGAGAER